MEVILLEKIRNLGNLGDKASVKAGFARNYLLPMKKALPATADNLRVFEERRAELEKNAADSLGIAKQRAEKLTDMLVQISMMASEEGKLYGSVGANEICANVNKALGDASAEIKKNEVLLPDGVIRDVGEFDIDIQVHSDVTVQIKIKVIPE